jgi:hypothetical protein
MRALFRSLLLDLEEIAVGDDALEDGPARRVLAWVIHDEHE